jgi:eukaryotic-like serine/threonine-protein kinase
VLGPSRDAGRTPLRTELAPGSYLVVLRVDGRPEVRYPVVVARGEALAIAVPVPAQVPAGYVYIPPGRFLYGSADSDELRRIDLMAEPERPVRTGGYLIGRHEVTWAEWMQFLAGLPESERGKRRPKAFGVELIERGPVPRLALEPSSVAYDVGLGQPLVYPGRTTHREVDWSRLPVSGISIEDARAFTHWLDASQRLPGARLCSEHEWERAARGADGRIYPHGKGLEPGDANYDTTYGRVSSAFGPDEVGSHPASDSPFGVADLAGNMWEYVEPHSGDSAFVRSGSFYQQSSATRATNRATTEPGQRHIQIGLRVCGPPPASVPRENP